jgi:hypothetical protein
MDSGPKTSPEAPGLGPAIAARVRPRLGIGRRSALTRVSIGGLARTVAGFGRSLGLARSARPAPVGGLSQATVRPPVGYWPWAESLEPPVFTTPVTAVPPRPAPRSRAPEVGSGDAKVDSLRRLLGLPPLVLSPPESREGVVSSPVDRAAPGGHRNESAAQLSQRSGATMAGAGTGPGQLGRRLVPEAVGADPATSSVVPTAPQGAPTTGPRRPAPTGAQRPARSSAVMAQPASHSARGGRDVESLQRKLAASGKLSNVNADRNGETGTSTSRGATPSERTSNRRPLAPGGGRVDPAAGSTKPPAARSPGSAARIDGVGAATSTVTTTATTTATTTTFATGTTSANRPSEVPIDDAPPVAIAQTTAALEGLGRMAARLTTTAAPPIARSIGAADTVRLQRLIPQTPTVYPGLVEDVDLAVRPAVGIVERSGPEGQHNATIAANSPRATPVASIAASIAAAAAVGERSVPASPARTRRASNLTTYDVRRRNSLPRSMSLLNRPISPLAAAVILGRREVDETTTSADGTRVADGVTQIGFAAAIGSGSRWAAFESTGSDSFAAANPSALHPDTLAPPAPVAPSAPLATPDPVAPPAAVAPSAPVAPPSSPSPSSPSPSSPSPSTPSSTVSSRSSRTAAGRWAAAGTDRVQTPAGAASPTWVQRASRSNRSRPMSTRTSTFESAVDQGTTTESDRSVVAGRTEDELIRWPSPGTLFASASPHRRAIDTSVSSAARRSVVAPGPGALRLVLQRTGATQTEATSNAAVAAAATRTAAIRIAATRDAATRTDASRHESTAGRPGFEGAPVAFTARAPSRRVDGVAGHHTATRARDASEMTPPHPTSPPRRDTPSRERVAARFLTELSRGERRRPQPLPTPYRPMAEAITGHHRVLISTDDASRRALRSVNKIAATTGDVIHLAAPPAVGARHTELLAHELTHVAHPSPAPRFFADDDRGPEERRADEIARVIARSPLAPTASIGRRATPTSVAATGTSTDQVIRRSTASRSKRAQSTSGTVSAAVLAEQITSGAMRPSSPTQTMRWVKGVVPQAPPVSPATSVPPVAPPTDISAGSSAFWDRLESTEGSDWFRRQLQANFDRIVRLLEHHVIGELERRGGRTWKGY